MHPLDGAYEQINGAWEHLDALKPEIDEFREVIANKISLKYKKGIINIKGKRLNVPIGTATAPLNQPAPPRTSRLIGEVIQSLRKALDYLVYELACFDSKNIVERTQFVIVDSENDFSKNLWHLKGLTGEHIAMFERLQPYNGCSWTKLIRDLSNPDKHRTLTAIRHFTGIHIDSANTEAILAGKQVDLDDYATIEITFVKGPTVIAGLQQLVLDVSHTLNIFKPEFQQ
jgi:hypothetical protein